MKIIKGVYCLTNVKNGKRYVGIGMGKKGIIDRWRHYRVLNCKGQTKLYNALKKYGPENFKYEVILETDDLDRANSVEKQLIALWNLQNDNYGYNIAGGGDNWTGRKCWNKGKKGLYKTSEETKKRLSNCLKGRQVSQETREKISKSLTGKKLSATHKENCRKGNLGRKQTIESLNKMIETKKLKGTLKIRRIKNIETGEIREGFLKALSEKRKLFCPSSLLKYGKASGWVLID